ncbi:vitamin K epoxide reductase family protein [Corynebacterium callunae]|uniref:vitamin K epoxide reductase family protein n=1 Tax=Corynebacterium callunae TaxID=1721 RepID=UPI0039826271
MSTETQTAPPKAPNWLGWVLLLGGIIGLILSVIIMAEKLKIMEDPGYITSCDFNEVLACGNVMRSGQSTAFGNIPNPLIGIAGFAAVAMIGAAILAGGRFRGWFWFCTQIGMTFAMAFCHWLAYQSMEIIRSLCPYCMGVWTVSIFMFVMVTVWNIKTFSGYTGGFVRALDKYKVLIAIVWLLIIAAIAVWEFRYMF